MTKRTLIYNAQQTTARSPKVGRCQNLNHFDWGAKMVTSDPVYLGYHVAVAAKTSLMTESKQTKTLEQFCFMVALERAKSHLKLSWTSHTRRNLLFLLKVSVVLLLGCRSSSKSIQGFKINTVQSWFLKPSFFSLTPEPVFVSLGGSKNRVSIIILEW